MIRIRNQGRHPLMIDSTIVLSMQTSRPPVSGAYEKLEDGDVLEIDVGYDVEIILTDGILSLRHAG